MLARTTKQGSGPERRSSGTSWCTVHIAQTACLRGLVTPIQNRVSVDRPISHRRPSSLRSHSQVSYHFTSVAKVACSFQLREFRSDVCRMTKCGHGVDRTTCPRELSVETYYGISLVHEGYPDGMKGSSPNGVAFAS